MNELDRAEHRHIGANRAPLLVIDDCSGDARQIAAIAADLGSFPAVAGNSYPGLRRFITAGDETAVAYVNRTLQSLAARINLVFGVNGFHLLEASFSIVTASPETLMPPQRVPHFDSTDPYYLAVLHYLSDTPDTGTAFYRQRATGIEQVTDANLFAFVGSAQKDSAALTGYIDASNTAYEQTAMIEGVRDRLVVYQGCTLHSGVIPPDMTFSPDPRIGRLTANFFLYGRPR